MKKTIFVIIILAFLGTNALIASAREYDVMNFGLPLNMRATITVGNQSYVPIGVSYHTKNDTQGAIPQQVIQKILTVVDAFQMDNPHVRILSWFKESTEIQGITTIRGVWINHEPK